MGSLEQHLSFIVKAIMDAARVHDLAVDHLNQENDRLREVIISLPVFTDATSIAEVNAQLDELRRSISR